ncbi:MAG: MGMT family protein [Natronincolaceae bacterium]|jgi:O-6-methylguanine DNA methyltransferase
METEEMIDFLETDTLSFIFSPIGLKYLSLKAKPDIHNINLRAIDKKQIQDPAEKLIIEETLKFLTTGRHAMPLDFTGFTEFQQNVFEAVGNVEPGKIVTYGGIAEALGRPGAARAVGSAVAKNPVSYFLPTHRVLPKKGIGICRTGAGYLREKLLEWEGHDLAKLRGDYVCTRKKCCQE